MPRFESPLKAGQYVYSSLFGGEGQILFQAKILEDPVWLEDKDYYSVKVEILVNRFTGDRGIIEFIHRAPDRFNRISFQITSQPVMTLEEEFFERIGVRNEPMD